ncbi:fibronectin type III domain-containing protein [Flagellimonas sp.]|uniref:fibronectin type III domain-containing protein n=1 Tax=Flagellimonas sp. TaxID=2058762 RepID=UPI003B5B7CF0
MNKLLLEKIEELTLYLIQLKKGKSSNKMHYPSKHKKIRNQNTGITKLNQQTMKYPMRITFLLLANLFTFTFLSANEIDGENYAEYGTYRFVDAETNTIIRNFSGDQTFALTELGNAQLLTIEAIPPVGSGVESLIFTSTIPGSATIVENNAPYGYLGASSVSGNYTGFTPPLGTYTFTIEYYSSNNGAGSLLATDSLTITFVQNNNDIQDPTAPTLSSMGQTQTTVDLSWSGATDNVGVTGYKIFKDGNLEATLGDVAAYQVTGLSAGTNYSFTATALDATNNESLPSNTVSVTTNASSGGGGSGGSVWSESGSVASYTGGVAIGTSTVPSNYKLVVEGNIRTREIRVDQDAWPDYVFKKGYDLPTLEEIQKHIDEKGHLPNIPSAKEVKANGIELGKMDKLLLEKIEEMMLHIIDQQRRIEILEGQNNNK